MMDSKLKHISLFSVWIAALVFILHAIIPHHHHLGNEFEHQECENSCHFDEEVGRGECNDVLHLDHKTDQEHTCSECHFNTLISPLDAKKQLKSLVCLQAAPEFFQVSIDTIIWPDVFCASYSFLHKNTIKGRAPPFALCS